MDKMCKRIFPAAAWAVCLVTGANAIDWNGNAGNFLLDDAANWASTPKSNATCYVRATLAQPLKVSTGDLFGGAMLRYTGAITVTNDFGAGCSLTNVGLFGGSALHVESGAKLVQTSGGIVAYKGTQFNGSYISNNSSLTFDGPDAWFKQETGEVTLRSTSGTSMSVTVHPQMIATNGATLTFNGNVGVGNGDRTVSAYFCAAGAGTTVTAGNIVIGSSTDDTRVARTNALRVADNAFLSSTITAVGYNNANGLLDVDGGIMKISSLLRLGTWSAASSNCLVRVTSGGSLTNLGVTAIGRVEPGNNATLFVSDDGSSFTGQGITEVTGGVVRVENGGSVLLKDRLSLYNARVDAVGDGASFTSTGETFARGTNVAFSATDGASITVPRLNVNRATVEGTLNYTTIYMDCANGEIAFTNATVTGTRMEMTKASTIRLYNTHLTMPSGIFMMGDNSGGNATVNAYERHVYVGGTDTWVRVTQNNGFYVRGSNTTMHVEIPAEGFSTSHPVFEIPKVSIEGSRSIRVEFTADPRLARKGGTYTLFKCSEDNSCHSHLINWIYDPSLIDIDKSVAKELRIRVKHLGGMIIIR